MLERILSRDIGKRLSNYVLFIEELVSTAGTGSKTSRCLNSPFFYIAKSKS